MGAKSGLFVGFDISTQQVKAVVTNDKLEVVLEKHVMFDKDLPEYKTQGGVHIHDDQKTITAPPQMWIQGIDMVLQQLKVSGLKFPDVAALSGTGQQHGSVYWKTGAKNALHNLNPSTTLVEQLKDCFSVNESPIWMDSSTTEQCRNLESSVGGPLELSKLTGSTAYERFTGNQIAKIFQQNRAAYNETERISLVSSMGASLFLGDYAAIDESDGSGMNLLNIGTRQWVPECLQACGNNLKEKLGTVVPSSTNLGSVSSYFVDRYGFAPNCQVIAWTGDNPARRIVASLAGMRVSEGDVVISLGTSDTLLLWLVEPKPALEGHILVNPVDTKAYMALLCFKNGSLMRGKIRNECAGGSWDKFNELLCNTSAGNNGNIGIYFDSEEIIPFAKGRYRFDSNGEMMIGFSPEVEIRALIEGQLLAKRFHAENLGYHIGPGNRILATGGGSRNTDILQVVSDVFNAPVYVQTATNSAALGCAYRAKHGLTPEVSFDAITKDTAEGQMLVSPREDAVQTYNRMLQRYMKLEKSILQ